LRLLAGLKVLLWVLGNVRKEKNIPLKESIDILVKSGAQSKCIFYPVIAKLGNANKIEIVNEKPDGSIIFTVGAQEFYIPIDSNIDVEAEVAKLEEELKYTNGFLISVVKKLFKTKGLLIMHLLQL